MSLRSIQSIFRNLVPHSMTEKTMLLFAVEGALLQFIGSINGFANNLFATNLGATDTQISLIQTIPNVIGMLLMLPMGMLSDRARTSRLIPMCMLCVIITGYVVMSLVPMATELRILMFFVALAFTVGGLVLYNAQWQSFFGDVVRMEQRNSVLTLRNRFMFIIGVGAPILCGFFMGRASGTEEKLLVLQIFYIICAGVTAVQLFTVSRIKAPVRADQQGERFTLKDTVVTIRKLLRRPAFRLFFFPVLLFYMTWQFDWSMWYIGQVQYLGLSETDMAIQCGVFNIGQLFAVGILAKLVRKYDAEIGLLLVPIGMLTCPVIISLTALMPQAMRMPAFTVLTTIFNATQCGINLCVVQLLLRVCPVRGRSIAVSFFTLCTTCTNSFMPYLGVQFYTMCGADRNAFFMFNGFVALLRFCMVLLFVWRYRKLRREGFALSPDTD